MRFVILQHSMPPGADKASHLDFMFEFEGSFRTWSVSHLPEEGERVTATKLPDHRLDYYDYEGPISNDRGSVSRYDRGSAEVLEETPVALRVLLHGELCQGVLLLTKLEGDWLLQCGP